MRVVSISFRYNKLLMNIACEVNGDSSAFSHGSEMAAAATRGGCCVQNRRRGDGEVFRAACERPKNSFRVHAIAGERRKFWKPDFQASNAQDHSQYSVSSGSSWWTCQGACEISGVADRFSLHHARDKGVLFHPSDGKTPSAVPGDRKRSQRRSSLCDMPLCAP